ncbi:MAG: hypothetical protein IPG96_08970 [Proteobacteria bacterium]|nr:hypothetical protein [Pseudomonadota bacterium]
MDPSNPLSAALASARPARPYAGVVTLPDPRADPNGAQLARLPLSPALRAQQALELRRRLAAHVAGQVEVRVTDNRHVMLSVKRDPRHRRYSLRAHHIFAEAPAPTIHALAAYVTDNDRGASRELSRFIDANEHRLPRRRGERRSALRTSGAVHDLAAVFNDLNRDYFDAALDCTISWGRDAARARARRSIRLGSFTHEENLIRIHPGLDQAWVPDFYLRWVVFHEMLHTQHPVTTTNGRRCFHGPAFAADERRFADYERAHAWERRNLPALFCI